MNLVKSQSIINRYISLAGLRWFAMIMQYIKSKQSHSSLPKVYRVDTLNYTLIRLIIPIK